MKGEPFHAPLFDTWRPLQYDLALRSDDSFIGDGTYLMPVQDKDGQVAIAEVRDTVFSLLPTDQTIPMASQWGKISYYTPVYADSLHRRGYVMGCDSTGRQYALCIDYAKKPAEFVLFYTDPLTDGITITIPVMTNEGNLMLTGIKTVTKINRITFKSVIDSLDLDTVINPGVIMAENIVRYVRSMSRSLVSNVEANILIKAKLTS